MPWQALFHAQKTGGNDAFYKLGQTWSRRALFSQNTVNPDSAVNTIPVGVCFRLLTITYAYKLDPRLSNHSRRIFKVSTGSEQVTLVRERYRQDAASGSPLPLNAFNFSLVWQAPGERTDIRDLSSPVDGGGFVFVRWGKISRCARRATLLLLAYRFSIWWSGALSLTSVE